MYVEYVNNTHTVHISDFDLHCVKSVKIQVLT
jgi:hypothetical protein